MTPLEFREIRAAAGLSANQMARAVGVASGRTVRRWEAGDMDIAEHVALRAIRLAAPERHLFSINPADGTVFITRVHPPGFIARIDQVHDDPMSFNLNLVDFLWLDPPPDDADTIAQLTLEAIQATLSCYLQHAAPG